MGIEIINGPFDVYLAPVGEAYPYINVAPAGNWDKVGANASRHYDEEGVVVEFLQEIKKHAGLGGTEVLKIMREMEEMITTFTLFDLKSGEVVKAFNLATTTTDTNPGVGQGGYQSFSLLRGLSVTSMAMLIRGEDKSPDLITENVQFEIPEVVQVASPKIVFSKGGKAGVEFKLQAIANYAYQSGAAPYGRLLIGDAVAT